VQIGQVATAAGVTTKALRYYERVGLIAETARTPSGYRDFRPPSAKPPRPSSARFDG